MILTDRTHILVISLWVSAGILIEITALDKHDHINIGERFEFYARMFSMAT